MKFTHIALLRGINVSGHNLIPMAELRALCEDLGFRDVRSYIQSGNLVFEAGRGSSEIETVLERGIRSRFQVSIPVIVRTSAHWAEILNGNPFPDAAALEPNRVLLALSKETPKPGAAVALQNRAAAGERVEQVGDALWIHYASGIGRSKLSPDVLDKLVGSPVTGRNLRTVSRIAELAIGAPRIGAPRESAGFSSADSPLQREEAHQSSNKEGGRRLRNSALDDKP